MQEAKKQVLLEAAVCHSVCHPNVVATYHYDILAVEASKPVTGRSGLTLHMTDNSKLGEFKMVIVQVGQGLCPGLRSRAYVQSLCPGLMSGGPGLKVQGLGPGLRSRALVQGLGPGFRWVRA